MKIKCQIVINILCCRLGQAKWLQSVVLPITVWAFIRLSLKKGPRTCQKRERITVVELLRLEVVYLMNVPYQGFPLSVLLEANYSHIDN